MLKIVRGRSFSFDATIYDTYVAEGNPGNVPTNHTGWTIRSQIRKKVGNTLVANLNVTFPVPTAGTVAIRHDRVFTRSLPVGDYWWDIVATDPSGIDHDYIEPEPIVVHDHPTDPANASYDFVPGGGGAIYHTHSISDITGLQALLDDRLPPDGGTIDKYLRGDNTWQLLNKAAVGLGDVENVTLSTWTGSSNITQLGTVISGSWQGSRIAPAYLGDGTGIETKFLRGDGTWQVVTGGSGDALVADTLDQFADVSQSIGATLTISATTVLSGGNHSGTNTGDQDLSGYATTATVAAGYQPLDSDLTSWANVTRASGFDTFTATPSSANLQSLVTDETGTGSLVFGTSPTFTTSVAMPAGSASVASINFGDTDSGFYAPTANSIAYASDGVQKFRSDANGLLVIAPSGAASRAFSVFDGSSYPLTAGLNSASVQAFGFGDITSGTLGRFERSTSTGLISFQMQSAASASTTFNIGHQDASFRVRGFTAQAANLQEWRNSSEAVLASVSAAGLGTFVGLTNSGTVTFSTGSAFSYGSTGIASAHRTALGATTVGDELFTAASPAAARETLELTTAFVYAVAGETITDADFSTPNHNERASVTTPGDDLELFLPVEANSFYEMAFQIGFSGYGNDGIKAQFNLPSILSFGSHGYGAVTGLNPITVATTSLSGTNIALPTVSTNNTPRAFSGVLVFAVGATAGNIKFQWSKNSTGASASLLRTQYSWMSLRKLGSI